MTHLPGYFDGYTPTHNVRAYGAGHPGVEILKTGAFVRTARDRISRL